MTFERKWRHGANDTRETYQSWYDMRTRCVDPTDPQFHLYGGRGIEICSRWRDDYDAFYDDMGPRPKGLTLERIDSNEGYYPANCRWATQTEQARNRRNNVLVTISGRTQSLTAWASEIRIDATTLRYRLRKNFSTEKLLAPADPRKQNFAR